jgi:hypothetical protein
LRVACAQIVDDDEPADRLARLFQGGVADLADDDGP